MSTSVNDMGEVLTLGLVRVERPLVVCSEQGSRRKGKNSTEAFKPVRLGAVRERQSGTSKLSGS